MINKGNKVVEYMKLLRLSVWMLSLSFAAEELLFSAAQVCSKERGVQRLCFGVGDSIHYEWSRWIRLLLGGTNKLGRTEGS